MQRINEDIKNGQFKNVYLLYGSESYLRKQYRDKLRTALIGDGDTMNYHYYEGKGQNVGEMIDTAETLPFFAERRVMIVENSELFKHGGEDLAEYLKSNCETTFWVFVEEEVDKRSKLYKSIQSVGAISEFSFQDEETLMRWIAGLLKKESKSISRNNLQLFLNKTGTDMENIRVELEKLICYCMNKDVVESEDIEAVCVTRISNHIFDMVNAIAAGRQKEALTLYYDLLTLKEPPLRILFLIARQCNTLLQVKELKVKGYPNKSIAEKMKIPEFVVRKNVEQAGKFKTAELKNAVIKCVEAEEAVKTGLLNETLSVELLIMTVLQKEG